MVKITDEPIDPAQVYQLISANCAGSVVLHYAVVKPQKGVGGTTCHIDYAAKDDAEGELRAIADELTGTFPLTDALLIRRTGRLGVGEIISLVAAGSPNSEDAFEACKLAIRRFKKMKCVVKNEVCG